MISQMVTTASARSSTFSNASNRSTHRILQSPTSFLMFVSVSVVTGMTFSKNLWHLGDELKNK